MEHQQNELFAANLNEVNQSGEYEATSGIGSESTDQVIPNAIAGVRNDKSKASPAEYQHDRAVPASLLTDSASCHERREIDVDDIARNASLAMQPERWLPFPVILEGNQLRAADGCVLLAAINEYNSEAIVPVEQVDVSTGIKIRNKDWSLQSKREPMARCRRAMIMRQHGHTNEEIAGTLGAPERPDELQHSKEEAGCASKKLTSGRITQLISAAEAEAKYPDLAEKIHDPFNTPPKFWERVSEGVKGRKEADKREPDPTKRTRLREFESRIEAVCQRSGTISIESLYVLLDIQPAHEPKTRGRHIGVETKLLGTNEVYWFAGDRRGGAVFNSPISFDQNEVIEAQAGVEAVFRNIILKRGSRPGN